MSRCSKLLENVTQLREQIRGDIDALGASNPKVKNLDVENMIDQSFVKNARKQQTAK